MGTKCEGKVGTSKLLNLSAVSPHLEVKSLCSIRRILTLGNNEFVAAVKHKKFLLSKSKILFVELHTFSFFFRKS